MSIDAAGSPSATDWLQGWGTVAGAIFAAVAAVVAVAVLRHDRRTSREAEAERAAEQSRSVLAGIDAEWEKDSIQEVEFSLHNLSQGIIVDIGFAFRRADGVAHQGGLVSVNVLPPGKSSRMWKMSLDPEVNIRLTDDKLGVMPPDLFETRVIFTDAAGRRWRRDGRAQPVRLYTQESEDLLAWVKGGQ
jgi:hypothetical protein